MGAGKQEAPPPMAGGDGTVAAAEPVVLGMNLHCAGCAKKVTKSIHRMPGVVSIVADPAANTVVVTGTADAAALKARIESRTKKPVQILSAGGTPPAAEPKKTNPDKHQGGGGEEKKNSDKAAGSSKPEHKGEEFKQPPVAVEKKPIEDMTPTTALLRIRLHCDSCADRIRRRIYKIKGVKDVVLEGNGAKDEVKVVGTMDVPAMLAYLNDKLNRAVELAPYDSKAKGGDDGHVKKDKGADNAHKGKGIEVAGPSVASAAASMAAPPGASTHHVAPYGYGVAYPAPQPQPQQGPPPGYYSNGYYGNADSGPGYYQQPRSDGGYYQQQPSSDAGGYFQQQPSADAGGYYQHQPTGGYLDQPRGGGGYLDQPSAGSYGQSGSYYGQQQQQPGGYPHNPPAYPFDTAPAAQMFSDENPNSCSLM